MGKLCWGKKYFHHQQRFLLGILKKSNQRMSKVENCVFGAESDFRRVDKDLSSLEERVSKQPIHSLCGEKNVRRATCCSATFLPSPSFASILHLGSDIGTRRKKFFWGIFK